MHTARAGRFVMVFLCSLFLARPTDCPAAGAESNEGGSGVPSRILNSLVTGALVGGMVYGIAYLIEGEVINEDRPGSLRKGETSMYLGLFFGCGTAIDSFIKDKGIFDLWGPREQPVRVESAAGFRLDFGPAFDPVASKSAMLIAVSKKF